MMTYDPNTSPLLEEGIQMLRRGIEFGQIRDNLASRTADTDELDKLMNAVKEYHYGVRRKRGTVLCIIGAVLLIFGCIVVLALHETGGVTRMAIYLPSIIGSGLVLWGLVDVLGW